MSSSKPFSRSRRSLALAFLLAACRGGGVASDAPIRDAPAETSISAPSEEQGEAPHSADVSPPDSMSRASLPPSDGVRSEVAGETAPPSAPSPAPATSEKPAPAKQEPAPATEHSAHNRDTKGERDVERYIQRLESPDRERELKVDVVLARMELPTDAIIGDLGCGPGIFALAFAAACPEGVIYASDIEPAQIDRVRTKADERGLRNVIPVLASAHDPHFPLAQLDYVFIGDTYHHLENRVEYMRRLKDVLKPGGKLVLLEYKPGPIPVGPPPDHKLAAGVMDKELEQAGYVMIDRFATHAWHDFEIWRRLHPWERR